MMFLLLDLYLPLPLLVLLLPLFVLYLLLLLLVLLRQELVLRNLLVLTTFRTMTSHLLTAL